MYGLIVNIKTAVQDRDTLIAILHASFENIPGCVRHDVAKDQDDDTLIWITEMWENRAAHQAALQMQPVKNGIAKGRPLIIDIPLRVETTPVL